MRYSFTVWLDADSCPVPLRDYIVCYAEDKNLNLKFVANREIPVQSERGDIQMIVCKAGKDSADNYIFENSSGTDIVITRDILFAKRMIDKKIFVMNDRGTVFTSENIEDRLAESRFSMNLAEIGFGKSKKSRYGESELRKFSDTFDRHVSQLIVNELYSKRR